MRLLIRLLIAGLLCAPLASIASSVGGSEAFRGGKDLCEAAGRSARRGHSTLLLRRNCIEVKTAEDFFHPEPTMKSAPCDQTEGQPQPPRPSFAEVAKMNLYEDDSEDGAKTSPLAAFGGGWKGTDVKAAGVWGGVATAPAKAGEWGSAVRGGYSEGGADVAGQARPHAPRQTDSAPSKLLHLPAIQKKAFVLRCTPPPFAPRA